jgi:hypothetical protein
MEPHLTALAKTFGVSLFLFIFAAADLLSASQSVKASLGQRVFT